MTVEFGKRKKQKQNQNQNENVNKMCFLMKILDEIRQ